MLAVAWSLVLVGGVVLVAGYDAMPDRVVLYRPPWEVEPILGSKSFLTVGRIAGMGIGQLGAATAMWFASRESPPWERFWRWLALTAGVKTLLECVGFLVHGRSELERAALSSTVAVVVAFALAALVWWRRGELSARPRVNRSAGIGVMVSLVLWAFLATAPRLGWH